MTNPNRPSITIRAVVGEGGRAVFEVSAENIPNMETMIDLLASCYAGMDTHIHRFAEHKGVDFAALASRIEDQARFRAAGVQSQKMQIEPSKRPADEGNDNA